MHYHRLAFIEQQYASMRHMISVRDEENERRNR